MAAQEPNKELRLCDKCFMMLDHETTFCPECGAPCGNDGAHGEGSDAAIYPELARANLLRMRGEYKLAEDVCRAILRRYPNNTSAAGLLGDISAEIGELEDAVRWYELVLDITPGAEAETKKLEGIHQRLKEHEALSTAEQLGLPVTKNNVGLYAGIVLAIIAIVGVAAFLLGRQAGNPKALAGNKVNVPYQGGTFNPSPINAPGDTGADTAPNSNGNALLDAVATKSSMGTRILDIYVDPRTRQVHILYRAEANDPIRYVGAHLARLALEHVSDAVSVNLRCIEGNKDVFFGEVSRSSLTTSLSSLGENPEADQDAFANAVLSNEWPTRSVKMPEPAPSEPQNSESGSAATSESAPAESNAGSESGQD